MNDRIEGFLLIGLKVFFYLPIDKIGKWWYCSTNLINRESERKENCIMKKRLTAMCMSMMNQCMCMCRMCLFCVSFIPYGFRRAF